MQKNNQALPDYGNWVSKNNIYVPLAAALFFLAIAFFLNPFFLIAFGFFLLPVFYFTYSHYKFSTGGGDIQNRLRSLVPDYLKWDGKGKIIDIGCGNGALTIKIAQKYPGASVTGLDYWGRQWDYSAKACESNAQHAGVGAMVTFSRASADKLPFADGYFDAAVSNLVFHEVHEAKDKKEVVREAFRVLKKGGDFAFQDLFLLKNIYGDIDVFLETIRSWGISEVHFMDTSKSSFIPRALKLPFMVGRIGIIYGKK
jgi:SAM-dependent methyltransferase